MRTSRWRCIKYKAVNATGDVAAGELDAANESEIVDRLRDQGLMPMQVEASAGGDARPGTAKTGVGPRSGWFTPRRVTRDHLLAVTRELATLLRAGLPLDRALEVLICLAPTVPVAHLLQTIRDDVRGGKSLSQALDVHRTVFSRFYVNIVRAGEAGGALGTVLTRLADTMERNKDLRESVKSALIYPTILIGVAITSVMVLLIFVVPQFQQTFAQSGKALPLPTQMVIVFGTALRKYWWLMIVDRRRARLARATAAARTPRCAFAGTSACCACRCWAICSARSRWRDSRVRCRRCSPTASRCSPGWRSSRRRWATACWRRRSTA